jgi:hypothetical protein
LKAPEVKRLEAEVRLRLRVLLNILHGEVEHRVEERPPSAIEFPQGFSLPGCEGVRHDENVRHDPAPTEDPPPGGSLEDRLGRGVRKRHQESGGSEDAPLHGGDLVLPVLMDGPPQRRVPPSGGEAQIVPAREGEEGLDRALPEGGSTQHHGPVVVLQSAGDDLRGTGAALVHQHHHAEVRIGQAFPGIEGFILVGGPPFGLNHHLARVQEIVGDGDTLIQGTSGIAPKIQDQPSDTLPHQGVHRRPHLP